MDIATEESEEGNVTLFNKKLNKILNKARIQDSTWLLYHATIQPLNIGLTSTLVLPTLLQDITNKAEKWGNNGKNGRIDPFTEIYDVSSSLRHDCFGIGAEFVLFSSLSL